jgi:hypothetical protein
MADEDKYRFRGQETSPTVIIGILLIFIVILGAALIYIITQPGVEDYVPFIPNVTVVQNVSEEPPPENVTNVTEACDDLCRYNMAIDDQNASACGMIINTTQQQDCYYQLSDISLEACLSLEDISRKEDCVTAFAVAGSNISLCDTLGDEATECRYAVDPCLLDENPDLCRALANDDYDECDLDTDCLLSYSAEKKDSEPCALLQNPVVSTACVSAATRNDKCYTLGKQAEQDYCYQLYATYTDNYIICTEITKDTVYALDCYSIFSAKMGDLSLCDWGNFNLNNKWSCYTNYSLLSGDISGCQNIHELATTNRFNCAFSFAIKYGNVTACQVIESLPKRSTCYQGAIIYQNENLDWRSCAGVTDFNWRNKCYTEAAKKYNDPSLCQYIDGSYPKEEEACGTAYELNQTG